MKHWWQAIGAVALLCLSPGQLRAADARPAIFAHGSPMVGVESNPVWVVASSGGAEPKTTVLLRANWSDDRWMKLPDVPARVIGISGHNAELVLVLQSTSARGPTWAWYSQSRYSSGPSLPAGFRLVALAGERRDLWALGQGDPVATRPATTTASPTAPATTRLAQAVSTRPSRLMLFAFIGQGWEGRGEPLPDPADVDSLSMAVIDGQPHVAVATFERKARLLRLDPQSGRWTEVGLVGPEGGAPERFKLLNLWGRPGLWFAGAGDGGTLWTGEQLVPLSLEGGGAVESDLAVTNDQLRLVFRREVKGSALLFEQRYGRDGRPSDKPQQLTWTTGEGAGQMNWWMMSLMALTTVLVISSLLKRRAAVKQDKGEEE